MNPIKENVAKLIIILLLLYVVILKILYKRSESDMSTRNLSISNSVTHYNSSQSEEEYFKFKNNSVVRFWIDVPNSFPWRKCLNVYNSTLYTYSCQTDYQNNHQIFTVVTSLEDQTKFRLYHKALDCPLKRSSI